MIDGVSAHGSKLNSVASFPSVAATPEAHAMEASNVGKVRKPLIAFFHNPLVLILILIYLYLQALLIWC